MQEKYFKLLSFIAPLLLFILYATLLANPQSTGYELSIYESYPFYFFILIALTLALSTYLSMYSIYQLNSKYYFIINVCWAFLTILLLYLIPLARGYAFFGRDDPLTHIGFIKDILNTGNFGQTNFYPIFHLFSYIIIILTGIVPNEENLISIRMLVPFLFFLVYTTFIFLITRLKVIENGNKNNLYSYISILLALAILNIAFTPADTLYLFFPLLLFIFYLDNKKRVWATRIIFIIILFLLPFGHPELVIFGLTLFIVYWIISYLISKYNISFSLDKMNSKLIRSNHILLLLTTFVIWYSTFTIFNRQVTRLGTWFIDQVGSSPLNVMVSTFNRADLPPIDFSFLIVKIYGSYILYLSFALIIGFLLLKKIINKKQIINDYAILFSLIPITIGFAIISLFNDVILSYGRILKYPILFGTILIAIYLTNNYISIKNSKKKFYAIFLLLIIASTITVFNIFPSPYLYSFNQQVTKQDISGNYWLINYGNRSIGTLDSYVLFGRYVDYKQGSDYSERYDRFYRIQTYGSKRFPPNNFNYTNSSALGTSYSSDRYMLTSNVVKDYYFKLFPNKARFTKEDFNKLDNSDHSVNILYENGEFNIYYINGLGKN